MRIPRGLQLTPFLTLAFVGQCNEEYDMLKLYNIDNIGKAYELTFFWGWNSLTNLGYSDVVPHNAAEMTWSCALLLFQVIFYSYILALGFNFIFKKDEKEVRTF